MHHTLFPKPERQRYAIFHGIEQSAGLLTPKNHRWCFPKNQDLHQINKAIFIWKAVAVPHTTLVPPSFQSFCPSLRFRIPKRIYTPVGFRKLNTVHYTLFPKPGRQRYAIFHGIEQSAGLYQANKYRAFLS